MSPLPLHQITFKGLMAELSKIDRRVLIQNTIITAIFVAFVFFLFLPILSQNKETIKEVKRHKLMIQGARSRIAKIPEMTKEKESLSKRADAVRQEFFDPQDIDQLISIISASANEADVQITASKPSDFQLQMDPPFNQQYMAVSYDLSLEGNYHSLGSFLNMLEAYPKSFVVNRFTIIQNQKDLATHKAQLIITAFLKNPSATGLMPGMTRKVWQ